MTPQAPPSLDQPTPPAARFVGGTLVLEGLGRETSPPAPFQWVNAKWRCPAGHYRTVRPWLQEQGLRNRIPRWRDLPLTLRDDREPHPYQAAALAAWLRRGSAWVNWLALSARWRPCGRSWRPWTSNSRR